MSDIKAQQNDVTGALNDTELDQVSGGDIRKGQVLKDFKNPKILKDDGLNIQTSDASTSNVGFDSPFTPIA